MKRAIRIAGIDRPVSPLALGTAFFQPDDADVWHRLLDAFVEHGGTVIDSARGYGHSEAVLGSWLASRGAREQVVLITKGGHGSDLKLPVEHFAQTIEQELSTSLDVLHTDMVDLYMLHRDNVELPVDEIMTCLDRERRRGRVRAFGASNWEYARVDEADDYAHANGLTPFATVSNNLSLPVPTGPFFPGLVSVDAQGEAWHQRTGTPLVAWSAQARGFLSGRYTPDMRGDTGGTADPSATKMLDIYGTDDNFARLRRAEELGARQGGYTAMQVGLAWLRHKPFPLVPIIGPRNSGELTSCIQSLDIALTPAERDWLDLNGAGR